MAVALKNPNRVIFQSTVTGTAAVEEGAAVSGYRRLADMPDADGKRFRYKIFASVTEWEIVEGVYTAGAPGSLSRDLVIDSTNNADPPTKVNFGAGTKNVSIVNLVEMGGVQGGELRFAIGSASSTAPVATYDPAPLALRAGLEGLLQLGADLDATAVFQVNGFATAAFRKQTSSGLVAPVTNEFKTGQILHWIFNGTHYVIVNAVQIFTAASLTAAGIIEIATPTELLAGADDTRAVSPAGLKALYKQGAEIADAAAITIPTGGGAYFTRAGTTTVTSIAIADGNGALVAGFKLLIRFLAACTVTHHATALILQGGANKAVAAGDVMEFVYEGSGNWRQTNHWPATAAAAPVLTKEFVDGTPQSMTAGGTIPRAHGLAVEPKQIGIVLVCETNDIGFTAGEKLQYLGSGDTAGANRGLSIRKDATNVKVTVGSSGLFLVRPDTGDTASITLANWKMVISAWA